MARRTTAAQKRQNAIEAIRAEHGALIETLMALTQIAPNACDCKRTTEHAKCSRCGACSELPNVRHPSCSSCGARSTYYRAALRVWGPRKPFAATFAGELLAKMLVHGWAPSPAQIALAHKLAAEQTASKPSIASKPAIEWATPRTRAWGALIALVARKFVLTNETHRALEEVRDHRSDASAESKQIAREAVELVRSNAKQMISDATGYDVLASAEDYADAMRAIAPSGKGKNARGDKEMYAALAALLDTHAWIIGNGLAVEKNEAA